MSDLATHHSSPGQTKNPAVVGADKPDNSKTAIGPASGGNVDCPAAERRVVGVPIVTDLNLEAAKEHLRDSTKAEIKRKNVRTAYKTGELVEDLDRRLDAGEQPFGTYLNNLGECPPPGAVYDLERVWGSRSNWSEEGRKRIERFGCQLNWLTKAGEPGYFHANKDRIPFAQEFSVLSHISDDWIQRLCDCGLFTKLFNGNRVEACWDKDWCRKCNWNGRIEPKQQSYSPNTWLKAGSSYGYTISYETDPSRARALGKIVSEEDFRPDNPTSIVYSASFVAPNWNVWGGAELARATPAFIEEHNPDVDDPFRRQAVQYASRRFLGACQAAIGSLVRQRFLDGADQQCEVAIGFVPFRMRWHIHGVGVSRVHDDPQAIADAIKEEADTRLAEIALANRNGDWPLKERLYANVMVGRFVEHDQLLQWIAYMYKTVNYWEPIRDVYLRSENLLPSGRLNPRVESLLLMEIESMREWIDETFTCKGLTLSTRDRTRRLSRSFTWGNLKFGDGDFYIRFETDRAQERRHERAEKQRERREARRERDRLARQLADREGL